MLCPSKRFNNHFRFYICSLSFSRRHPLKVSLGPVELRSIGGSFGTFALSRRGGCFRFEIEDRLKLLPSGMVLNCSDSKFPVLRTEAWIDCTFVDPMVARHVWPTGRSFKEKMGSL